MQSKEKVLVCAIPYLAAGYMWFALVNPAFLAGQDKSNELVEKKKQQIELKTKLFDLSRLEKEKNELTRQIEQLRDSVPKSPDMDILMIDLEKMCLESGMDIISVEEPEKEKQQQLEKMEEEARSHPEQGEVTPEQGINLARKLVGVAPVAPGTVGKASSSANNAKQGEKVETGLSKLVKQVMLTGNYPEFVKLMKKLESYKRVIGVSQIEAELPAEIGKSKAQEVRQLVITLMITAYYLP